MAKTSDKIWSWSFMIGAILAVIFGLLTSINIVTFFALLIAGIIVGFLNVSERDVSRFLISGSILVVAASFGSWLLGAISVAGNILNAVLVIFVPATAVVAAKMILSKN